MPRTNVVGTTAAAGSGAQRCAQAGERKHRTDSTTGTAVTTAANRLSDAARGAPCRVLYDGREKLGSIEQRDGEFVAYGQRGQVIGRFDTTIEAANAISKAAARGGS